MIPSAHCLFGTPGFGPAHWLTATTRGESAVDFGKPFHATTTNCPSSTPSAGVTVIVAVGAVAAPAAVTPVSAAADTARARQASARDARRLVSARRTGGLLQVGQPPGTPAEQQDRCEHEERDVQRREHERCCVLRPHVRDRAERREPYDAELPAGVDVRRRERPGRRARAGVCCGAETGAADPRGPRRPAGNAREWLPRSRSRTAAVGRRGPCGPGRSRGTSGTASRPPARSRRRAAAGLPGRCRRGAAAAEIAVAAHI